MNESNVIVIDNGSYMIRAGSAGEEGPSCIIPTLVGKPKRSHMCGGKEELYIGDKAEEKRAILNNERPIKNGVITNWDNMENLWSYTFSKLNKLPEEYPILMTEPLNSSKEDREHITEILFETYDAYSFCMQPSATFALYASGKTAGCVVDCGYEKSRVIPVYEGFSLSECMTSMDIGGNDLDEYLQRELRRQYYFNDTYNINEFRKMKEAYCYVSVDNEKEEDILMEYYSMPDGYDICIKNERVSVPEMMFSCNTSGNSRYQGIHQATCKTILKCDTDLHKEFFGNIVLAGGCTKFSGFGERMQKEVESISPANVKVTVQVCPNRDCMAWVGGSVFTYLSSFQKMCISREEYNEKGSAVVNNVCF